MSEHHNYGPSVPLCRLYERVSAKGNHYLVGRLGGAKISILKSSDTTDDGVPIWNVLLQQAPHKADNGERRTVRTEADEQSQRPRRRDAADTQRPL